MKRQPLTARPLLAFLAISAVAMPAGYSIAQEVATEPEPVAVEGVAAEACAPAVSDAYDDKGLSYDTYAPDCPTAEQAKLDADYTSRLRRYGLTRILEGIERNPTDTSAETQKGISAELAQLGGPLDQAPYDNVNSPIAAAEVAEAKRLREGN